MNHLLAQLKGKNATICKVTSEERSLYELPNLGASHDFCPSYKLDENEWHKIGNFSNLGFENSIIGQEINTANYCQISQGDFQKIIYIFCIQDNYIFFQRFTPSQILKKKWLSLSGTPSLHYDEPIIIINSHLDAIYDAQNNTLYFKDLGRIKPIFPGIDTLYRQATQEEVETFLGQGFIQLEDGYNAQKVGEHNRKRIALVKDRLESLPENKKQSLISYARRYVTDIKFENGSFHINSEAQLKKLLYAIDERYYRTEVGEEHRLANSIQRIDSSAVTAGEAT